MAGCETLIVYRLSDPQYYSIAILWHRQQELAQTKHEVFQTFGRQVEACA